MAELLIRASGHWLDSKTPEEVNAMSERDRDGYNARTQIGDIICVRPDGWEWGKEECLPTFIVVRLPQYNVDDAKHFEYTLAEEHTDAQGRLTHRLLKRRKYRIPENIILNYAILGESVVTVELTLKQQQFINNIIEKTS